MAGMEREFMSKMDSMMASGQREQQPDPISFLEASHCMRDFWRLNAGSSDHRTESHHLGRADAHMEGSGEHGGDQAITGMMHQYQGPDTYSLRSTYSYGAPPRGMPDHHAPPSSCVVPMEVSSHDVYYTNLCHPVAYNPASEVPYANTGSSSSSEPYVPAHATYTNFFHPGSCSVTHSSHDPRPSTQYNNDIPNHYSCRNVSPSCDFVYSSGAVSTTLGTLTPGENISRDMESLRRELAFKCPRSNEILTAITSTAEATVQEHGSTVDDDDDDPHPPRLFPLSELEQDQDLRAAIVEHPYYPELVVAHVRVFKIGAPKELRIKLDDITKKFQSFQESGDTTRIGDDPSLDTFMRSYVDLLRKLGDDVEEPFNNFMQFKDSITKQLDDICGHPVETGLDETDSFGYDIREGPIADGGHDNEELDRMKEELDRMKEDQNALYPYNIEVDESIVIDASLPEDELRKKLKQKYGRHIGGLKAEFNRVRRKGKLPSLARNILKDWFNRHSYWPYPSEAEKEYLQRMCALNLKQINNWFINERKRHWSCEGKCMHPNPKFYDSPTGHGEDKGHLD